MNIQSLFVTICDRTPCFEYIKFIAEYAKVKHTNFSTIYSDN